MQLRLIILSFFAVFLAMPVVASEATARDFIVVIDPGHGGKDYGAIGINSREKDINLGVAKKLGNMIEDKLDGVKVVYTRDNDTFLSLQKRAQIANNANGDLFISIHTNSIDKRNKKRKTIAGASVYTLGLHKTEENLEVAKRENAVIELEEDYSTSYSGFDPKSSESYIIFELNQNKHLEQSIELAEAIQQEFISTAKRKDRGVRQAGFLVLAATSMPSALVELDFICNPTQEKYLASKSGQKELATAIFNAFKKYHSKHGTNIAPVAAAEHNKPIPQERGKFIYKIQILTSTKKIGSKKTFKGLSPVDYYIDGDTYKYTYGRTGSKEEAQSILKSVKEKFPEAFIIKTLNGKRVN